MQRLHRTLVASAAVAVIGAAALTGCGGSKNSGGSPATTSAGAADGKQIFATVGCASCHTLKAAGAAGHVGPNLDQLKPSEATVARQVTNGGGGMPAFKDQLDAGQIRAVARYVAQVAGK